MTIFLMGQFEIARFKNINVIQNNLSDKQLNKMQANLAEQYPVVCQKINENILGIVKEVNKYLPTDILLYAFMEMAVNHINIESEVEIEEDGVLAYRMLDYLQSIIASVPTVEGNKQELTDNRWNKLKELVGSLYYLLNQDYHICQTAYKRTQQPDIDIEYEEYIVKAQLYWCNVRGHRFLNHQESYFHDLLTPHSTILNELFGFTAEQLITEILKIQHSLTNSLNDVYHDLFQLNNFTINAINSKVQQDELSTEEDISILMDEVIKENNLELRQQEIFSKIYGLDIFDLEKITDLPINFRHPSFFS